MSSMSLAEVSGEGIRAALSVRHLHWETGRQLGPCPYLHFYHVDGIPAAFDLLGSISSLLYEDHSSEAMIKIPEVD